MWFTGQNVHSETWMKRTSNYELRVLILVDNEFNKIQQMFFFRNCVM